MEIIRRTYVSVFVIFIQFRSEAISDGAVDFFKTVRCKQRHDIQTSLNACELGNSENTDPGRLKL